MTSYKAEPQPRIKLDRFQVSELNLSTTDIPERDITQKLGLELRFRILGTEDKKSKFAIEYETTIQDDEEIFKIYCKSIGHFSAIDVDDYDEFLESDFVIKSAPAIAFPYLRSFLTTITVNAGYSPVIMPSFNFTAAEKEDLDESNEL